MADYIQVMVTAENASLVRAIDNMADGGEDVAIVLPRTSCDWTQSGEKRQAVSRVFDILREAGCSVQVLSPDGSDALRGA